MTTEGERPALHAAGALLFSALLFATGLFGYVLGRSHILDGGEVIESQRTQLLAIGEERDLLRAHHHLRLAIDDLDDGQVERARRRCRTARQHLPFETQLRLDEACADAHGSRGVLQDVVERLERSVEAPDRAP